LKVLHVHSGNLFGGVESMLLILARSRGLVPGMSPEFALAFAGNLSRELRASGAAVHDIGEVRARYPMSVWRGRLALARIIRDSRPDVMLFHSFWAHALFAAVPKRERVPFATWVHDLTGGQHWLERWSSLSPPARFLTSSEFIAGGVRARYPAVPVIAIHPPVELRPAARPARREPGVTIVQVGRLEEWKGHRNLLEALGALRDLPGWRCQIVGGPQRASEDAYLIELREQAERLGIGGRVEFLGQRSDVPDILAGSDVFCQVNARPEPFGIAIVEAMLASLPVVTAAMGGALEIVDSRSGVLVEPGDSAQLAHALRALIESEPVRRAAGEHGSRRAAALTDPQRQIECIASALEEAQVSR
jgi:glycosyltransferase involved in cell wall biosynthesis